MNYEPAFPFKFAESCMYNYLENVARIEALRDELKILDKRTVKVQKYEEHLSPRGYIENVPERLFKIDALEALIKDIERYTSPITRLLVDLESPYNLSTERQGLLGILQVRYLHKNTWERTLNHLEISRMLS